MRKPAESVIFQFCRRFERGSHRDVVCPIPSCQKAALDNLKFKKSAKKPQSPPEPSSVSSTSPWATPQANHDVPPAQSRDGTVSSRYFSATPSSAGNILVPSSSPPPSDPPHREHRSLFDQNSDDAIPGLVHTPSEVHSRSSTAPDALSAPSGFTSTKRTADAFSSHEPRPTAPQTPNMSSPLNGHDGERPRKRQNRGDSPASPDPIDLLESPGSPEIVRPGQRRKAQASVLSSSASSDESLHESTRDVAGPSKPRLVRGQRSDSAASSATEGLPNSANFLLFQFSNPTHTAARARAAWQQSGGDAARATTLLNDPAWQPPKPVAVATVKRAQHPAELGRVKEVEEASKAERARVKEMGKKSMIYASRPGLPTVTPPASKAIPNTVKSSSATPARAATPLSPGSPEIGRARPKRLQRRVVDSDSEADFAESDDAKSDDEDDVNEQAAFDYFNSCSPAALQELTGTSNN